MKLGSTTVILRTKGNLWNTAIKDCLRKINSAVIVELTVFGNSDGALFTDFLEKVLQWNQNAILKP